MDCQEYFDPDGRFVGLSALIAGGKIFAERYGNFTSWEERKMVFRKSLRRCLNVAICVFGCLSPLYLFMVWATTQDIQKEYLSTRLLAKYNMAIPSWYVWDVHSCHGEWATFSLGLALIIIFHLLLFARFVISNLEHNSV